LPRGLNVPPASTDANADYHVAGTPDAMKGDLRFAPTTVAGARIAQGSDVGFSFANPHGASSVRDAEIGYNADVTVADLDLQRVGHEFKVAALDTERYKSAINAHLIAKGAGTD